MSSLESTVSCQMQEEPLSHSPTPAGCMGDSIRDICLSQIFIVGYEPGLWTKS